MRGLVHAFERATGRPAKVTDYPGEEPREYGGDFLELVKTMLPLTRETAQQFGWRMSHPQSPKALGKYVEKFTSKGKSLPYPWLISDRGAPDRPVTITKPISDPAHWRDRAAELRALADQTKGRKKLRS